MSVGSCQGLSIFSSPNMVKLARIRMGADCILIHCFGQVHRSELETKVPPEEIRYQFFMPIVLGRDSAASGDAKYSAAPGGFTLQGAASADLAPGGIAILRSRALRVERRGFTAAAANGIMTAVKPALSL